MLFSAILLMIAYLIKMLVMKIFRFSLLLLAGRTFSTLISAVNICHENYQLIKVIFFRRRHTVQLNHKKLALSKNNFFTQSLENNRLVK